MWFHPGSIGAVFELLEVTLQRVAEFLRQTITLEINGTKSELGALQPLGWPVDAGESVEEKNYGQTLVHFIFKQESRKVIEDFYVLYEVYAQLGAVHRVVANIEQEDKHMEVVFTQFEPDYLYDTFWRGESEPALTFRGGVHDAWSRWWIALVVALVICVLPPGRLGCLVECLAVLWVLLAVESHPQPGYHVYVAGLVSGVMVAAFIAWPVRTIVRSTWKRRAT